MQTTMMMFYNVFWRARDMSHLKQWQNYGYLQQNNSNETRDDYSDALTSDEFQGVITEEDNNVDIQHVKSKTI